MTRAEAIDMCSEVRHYLTSGNPMWDKEEVGEALDMAVEALKQVKGKLNNPDDSLLTEDSEESKQQKSKLDLIRRVDAQTELMMNAKRYTLAHESGGMGHVVWDDELIKITDALDILRALPSADRPTDIVRCGECKHMMPDGRCEEFADDAIRPSASDFCSYGERSEL